MRFLVAAALIIFLSAQAFAISDMDIRDNWAKSITVIKNGECKNEAEFVRQELDYAATMLLHGEFDETRASLKGALEEAKSEKCKKAIQKNKTAPR